MSRKLHWMIGPISLLAIWSLVSAFHLVRPIFLPTPIEVGRAFFALLGARDSGLLAAIGATLLRVLLGLFLGTAIGIPIGLLMGLYTRAYSIFEMPLDFFRSIPVTALFPFFLLVFGIEDDCKVIIASWAVALIMAINTIYGVRGCSQVRGRYLKSLGANAWHTIRYQIIPEALPSIVGGFRISISQSFIVVLVTEMLFGADAGLGYLLYSSSLMYKTDEVVALIIVAGFLGYFVNRLTEKAGKRVVFWQ